MAPQGRALLAKKRMSNASKTALPHLLSPQLQLVSHLPVAPARWEASWQAARHAAGVHPMPAILAVQSSALPVRSLGGHVPRPPATSVLFQPMVLSGTAPKQSVVALQPCHVLQPAIQGTQR